MGKPIGFIVSSEGRLLATDGYGGVLTFKSAEDAKAFMDINPLYKYVFRLQRAKIPRKRRASKND